MSELTCSLEEPGMACSPHDHHPGCYYAANPRGWLPPRIAELELRRLIAEGTTWQYLEGLRR